MIGILIAAIHLGILTKDPRFFTLTIGSTVVLFDIIYIVKLAKTKP